MNQPHVVIQTDLCRYLHGDTWTKLTVERATPVIDGIGEPVNRKLRLPMLRIRDSIASTLAQREGDL